MTIDAPLMPNEVGECYRRRQSIAVSISILKGCVNRGSPGDQHGSE